MEKQYIFGPVPSRRLGISLGVDLMPHKTCSLDCVYCECGETTVLTTERKEYIPTADILRQLDAVLERGPELDYITFSGAGEPTLHSGIGDIIRHIKNKYPHYKICLLTNGTLLGDAALAEELRCLDLIIPSLDATSDDELAKVNRPAPGISARALIDGLAEFRKSSPCEFWLEVFIVPGVNDSDKSLASFVEAAQKIMPDKIQLNTLDRPGCVDWIKPASEEVVARFVRELEHVAPVEAVGKFSRKTPEADNIVPLSELEGRLIELVNRRPCTLEDISFALGVDDGELKECLFKLKKSGRLVEESSERGVFYRGLA